MRFLTKFKIIGAIMVVSSLSTSTWATTYYVNSKFQGESPSGDSWLSAFPDLNMALEAAATNAGSQIWVSAGIYTPDGSSRDTAFIVPPNTQLYGGFTGSETNLTERNPKAYPTRLSGDIGRAGSFSDNCYHVLKTSGDTLIDGFTIQRGNANSIKENRFGGGLNIAPGSKNVQVSNCIFEKNNAESGGAIHLSVGELTATNCTFYSNSADTGGAIATLGASKLTVKNCIFTSNFSPKMGGALMLNNEAQADISESTFLYNSTDDFGGAIAAHADAEAGNNVNITDCTFSENSARNNGGALGMSGPFVPVIKNCTFEKNFSTGGAGALANRKGTTTVLLDSTFARNRGSKGLENIGNDESSTVVESEEAAAELARKLQEATQPAEIEIAPEPQIRMLPDLYIYNARNQAKIKLSSVVSGSDYTVLVFGDLTDDVFIKNFQTVEIAAREFHPKRARFFYIYRNLKHPENNGFIKPFNLRERAQHTVIAKKRLQTAIPWLYDSMENQAAAQIPDNSTESIFIFDSSGEEKYRGSLADKKAFRKTLVNLVGKPDSRFKGTLPPPDLEPIYIPESKYLARATGNPDDQFQPLEITLIDSSTPFYVKARVEGSESLLETGDGKIYLGFHIDPLYSLEWNNLGEPLKYTLKTPQGVVAPSINSAQRVTAAATDDEPREFILQARKLDLNQPLQLQVTYAVHTSSRKNIEVTQQYLIYLSEDPFGGQVIGRQIGREQKTGGTGISASDLSAHNAMLRRFDRDRNGKLTKDEVIGGLHNKFEEIDQNDDGSIDAEEYAAYRKSR